MAYRTPGVYVEEISTLPPSVAAVATAVPAFIGYTEKGLAADESPLVVRVDTLLEYESTFGGAKPSKFTITTSVNSYTKVEEVTVVERDAAETDFIMHYCLSMYFNNGGGSCYIVSIGNYKDAPTKDHFEKGLEALEKEDEPTLILLTDAVNLGAKEDPYTDYYTVCQAALDQCKKLGDRFTILDVKDGNLPSFRGGEDSGGTDRAAIVANHLMYGAAYTPYLQTSLNYRYLETEISIKRGTADNSPPTDDGGVGQGVITPSASSKDLVAKMAASEDQGTVNLESIKSTETALYNQIKTALAGERVVLPPSAAVAGVYARVDRERGVWKAPANVSLSSVIGPVDKITNTKQDILNVDPTAGKSINAIRAFTGKGTLVWGARTLAGNDNEWRYIPVRRLFNTIEESTRKATSFAVFEPNDATTWLKVKAMIESYLYGLWEQGALAGPTSEAAYFVNVGLGKTMTPQDVLEGRMIVEIGVAAVRPAEFIILKFTHKLQEA